MLESVLRRAGQTVAQRPAEVLERAPSPEVVASVEERVVEPAVEVVTNVEIAQPAEVVAPVVMRKKWSPKAVAAADVEGQGQVASTVEGTLTEPEVSSEAQAAAAETAGAGEPSVARKKWTPKGAGAGVGTNPIAPQIAEAGAVEAVPEVVAQTPNASGFGDATTPSPARKKWEPKKSGKTPDSGE